MDHRKALAPGKTLETENTTYRIKNEKGRGGSCIVYDATYESNQGIPIPVCIKECYPFDLDIKRSEDGTLIVSGDDRQKFDQYVAYLEESFRINTELYNRDMHNEAVAPDNTYYANNTVYMVTRSLQGTVLAEKADYSLTDIIKIVKSVSASVGKIHSNGYLYLDIKPTNILVVDGHPDFVQLFDFDSLIPVDLKARRAQVYRISYTDGFASIEQRKGDFGKIGTYSDVYSQMSS